VRRVKYEEYGIIDGDAEDLNLFEEEAAQQQHQRSHHHHHQQQYVADVASQVMTGKPAAAGAPRTAAPAAPTAPGPKPKFSFASVTKKYVPRIERAQAQLTEEMSAQGALTNEQHTGLKHAVKYRNLDGTVYYEDSTGQLKEEDVFVNTNQKAIDANRTVWQPLKKGKLVGIMNNFKDHIDKYGYPDEEEEGKY